MSEALYSTLPRFDVDSGPLPSEQAGRWQRPLHLGAEEPPVLEPEIEPVPEEAPADIPSPQAIDLTALEGSLTLIAGKLDRMEQESKALALQSVQSMAAKLFPELSQHFLAEEIGRHLEALVPASAAVIEIRAESELAEQLRAQIDRNPGLAQRCAITPLPMAGQGRVDVSWQSGGLSFDFDRLLAACLSQLTSAQPIT